jgi:hypothetical protein
MDRFLARVERRFGYLAIPGLSVWLVGLMALSFVLEFGKPGTLGRLMLDPARVMDGEYWRLVTWVFITPTMSPIWVLFTLAFYHTMATALEEQWGSFRFQLFLLVGMTLTTTMCMALGMVGTNTHLLMSLFLAFATLWPDYTIQLYFILPVKVKWLAWLDVAFIVLTVVTSPGLYKLFPVVALGNYLLFFAPHLLEQARGIRRVTERKGAMRDFQKASAAAKPATRTCAECGINDVTHPRAEFRVCTCEERCHGKATTLCLDHVRAHV